VIVLVDEACAERDVAAGRWLCTGCGGSLRPWGYARERTLRGPSGTVRTLRPRRLRCRPCRVGHVLLPAWAPPRRADTLEVIGAGLQASAEGASDRIVAEQLTIPAATVRGWQRRVTGRADRLRGLGMVWALQCDPHDRRPRAHR
jgi:Domain of unknown function (DUF6431)